MSRNGIGTYNLVSGNPVASGTSISSTVMNNTLTDIATAVTNSIATNGETPILANLPMSGFKHTGVADGSSRTDYSSIANEQDGIINWVAAGGTADAITATYTIPVTTVADGQIFNVRASAANATTTPTFSPSGLPGHTITTYGGGALVAGNIAGAGHEMILRCNLANTRYELLNPKTVNISGNSATATTATTATNLLGGTVQSAQLGFQPGVGVGGQVIQLTNKSTSVTLNKACGTIVMNGAALAAGATVTFQMTNNTISAYSVVVASITGPYASGPYQLNTYAANGVANFSITNTTASPLSEVVEINFAVIAGANY